MEPDFKILIFIHLFHFVCIRLCIDYDNTKNDTSDKDNLYSQTFHLYFAALFFSLIIGFFIADGKFYFLIILNLIFYFNHGILRNFSNLLFLFLIGLKQLNWIFKCFSSI